MVKENGDPVLIDYGLSLKVGKNGYTSHGVFTFMMGSPEQLQSTDYSFDADIYQLGQTLFYVSCGFHPFIRSPLYNPWSTLLSVLYHLTKKEPNKTPSEYGTDFQSLIFSMLSFDKKDRPNISQVVERLEKIIGEAKEI